jgi:L-threonylcarbamoyladenylate synthase
MIGTDLSKAASILNSGGLVAIPTETVYGLAANGLNPTAVAKIFQAKNRPTFNPLILHCCNLKQVESLVQSIPNDFLPFLKEAWPGPVTVILPRKDIVPDIVTAGLETVAVRIPRHPLTLNLLNQLEFPLAAPSANPSGYVSPTEAIHVEESLGNQVDYILDGGPCTVGIESTIIQFDGGVRILRLGGWDPDAISKHFKGVEFDLIQNSKPLSPGQMDKHYSPNKKLLPLSEWDGSVRTEACALLSFQKTTDVRFNKVVPLSSSGNLEEASTRLFKLLRECEQWSEEMVFVELAPERGLGRAINDRLRRAMA